MRIVIDHGTELDVHSDESTLAITRYERGAAAELHATQTVSVPRSHLAEILAALEAE